ARDLRADVEHALSPDDLHELGDLGAWVDGQVKQLWSPWWRWFIDYDPAATLAKVHCPVLAVNGGMDKQVAAGPNLDAIRRARTGPRNKDTELVEWPGLNHLSQAPRTGAGSE